MELHLHLTVAFRGLDRKWGKPVDLESLEDLRTCLPAVVDRATTTFSSEDYLRTKRRTPYSRHSEKRRRKDNVKVNDSFCDISSARIPSLSDLGELSRISSTSGSVHKEESSSVDMNRSTAEYLEDYEQKYQRGSSETLDSGFGSRKRLNVFRQIKDTAKSFIDKKCKNRFVNVL